MNTPNTITLSASRPLVSFADHFRLASASYLSLAGLVDDFDPKLALRMRDCGAYTRVFGRASGVRGQEIVKSSHRCGVRQCPYCGRKTAWLQYRRCRELILDGWRPGDTVHFFTLTMPGVRGEDLKSAIARFKSYLSKFTKSVAGRRGIDGKKPRGARFIEITRKGEYWHVHAHFLTTGLPLNTMELRTLWRRCSDGGASVASTLTDGGYSEDIDLSIPGHVGRVSHYIAKGAPVEPNSTPEELLILAEVMRATRKGVRLFSRFGNSNSRTEGEQTQAAADAPVASPVADDDMFADVRVMEAVLPAWRLVGIEYGAAKPVAARPDDAAVVAAIRRSTRSTSRTLRAGRMEMANLCVAFRGFQPAARDTS